MWPHITVLEVGNVVFAFPDHFQVKNSYHYGKKEIMNTVEESFLCHIK